MLGFKIRHHLIHTARIKDHYFHGRDKARTNFWELQEQISGRTPAKAQVERAAGDVEHALGVDP